MYILKGTDRENGTCRPSVMTRHNPPCWETGQRESTVARGTEVHGSRSGAKKPVVPWSPNKTSHTAFLFGPTETTKKEKKIKVKTNELQPAGSNSWHVPRPVPVHTGLSKEQPFAHTYMSLPGLGLTESSDGRQHSMISLKPAFPIFLASCKDRSLF